MPDQGESPSLRRLQFECDSVESRAGGGGRFIAPFVPYPQFPNGVSVQTWIGSSTYNSVQLKAEKRFSSGLGFIALTRSQS